LIFINTIKNQKEPKTKIIPSSTSGRRPYPNLLDLILFSEKRKDFLLLLKEGPKNAQEILDRLQVPRTALLPQIKKLKEQNLVIH